MQQTLFIVILAVAIAFVLAYRWKKKAENKMDNMSLNYKQYCVKLTFNRL